MLIREHTPIVHSEKKRTDRKEIETIIDREHSTQHIIPVVQVIKDKVVEEPMFYRETEKNLKPEVRKYYAPEKYQTFYFN